MRNVSYSISVKHRANLIHKAKDGRCIEAMVVSHCTSMSVGSKSISVRYIFQAEIRRYQHNLSVTAGQLVCLRYGPKKWTWENWTKVKQKASFHLGWHKNQRREEDYININKEKKLNSTAKTITLTKTDMGEDRQTTWQRTVRDKRLKCAHEVMRGSGDTWGNRWLEWT